MIQILILFLLSLAPACLRAQNDWQSLDRLQSSQTIEILDSNMKTHRGSFVAVAADSLTLQTAAGPATLSRDAIARVSLRQPGRKRRNILLGAAIGAGAGLAAGLIVNRRFANEGRDHLATAILAPLGAGAGAALGAASGGWETIYRAKTITKPTP